ncbi:MAG: DUF6600 domain-containing protein [Ignavibacteria bacterium]|jgi:hypothetical protein
MNIKILLRYILPLQILLLFAIGKTNAQVEVDTSNMGPPSQDPTLQDFQDSLSRSGDWEQITTDEIDPDSLEGEDSQSLDDDIYTNEIWVPNPALIWIGWNPYCYGRWVWTYWGWEWIPYDNWGWCTYHYGRWWWHHHYGWVWSPGHRWRHCWVSWHRGGGYWGWHPLPPRVHYKSGVSVLPITKNTEKNGWVFVNKKDFTKPVDKKTIIDVNKYTGILKTPNVNVKKKDQGINNVNKKSWVDKTRIPEEKTQTNRTNGKPNINSRPNDNGKKIYTPGNHNGNSGKGNNNNSGNRNSSGPKSNHSGNSNHTGSSHNSGNPNHSGNSSHSGNSNHGSTSKGKK